jgi:hypothetical protein
MIVLYNVETPVL